MAEKTIYLRGHHLRILHHYATLMTGNEQRVKIKDETILGTAIINGHSKKHGYNAISVMKKALDPKTKIRLTDMLDAICITCNNKNKKMCKEFIPYKVSAASDDRATMHYYGLKKRTYTSKNLVEKLLEKEPF